METFTDTSITGTPGNLPNYRATGYVITARTDTGYGPGSYATAEDASTVYNPAVHVGVPLISPYPFTPQPGA